jgi:hypothetical protein
LIIKHPPPLKVALAGREYSREVGGGQKDEMEMRRKKQAARSSETACPS